MIYLRNRMRIEDTLYKYLVLFEELCLPGIGTLHLTRTHAVHDIAGKKILPPAYTYSLVNAEQTPARKLFLWVMEEMEVPESEAVQLINDFAYDIKSSVNLSNDVKWDKVGRFTMMADGIIGLESEIPELLSEVPVPAEKLIEDNMDYSVRTGEREVMSSEMAETLQEPGHRKKDITWLIAWILLIAAVMFTGIYFSQNGFKVSSAGNKTQIKVDK